MRQLTLLSVLFVLLLPELAQANLERQIYYFSRQSDLFKNICFDGDGQFKEGAVLFEASGSLRQTAIDCDAQAIALNQQRLQIEEQIQAGGANCDLEIRDPELIDFMSGIESVADQVQCPGNGGGLQCVGDIACNLTSSLVPRFTRDVASLITGSQPRSCGSDGGTNCIENLLAGAVFNLKDTGCGIASLFGYNCDQAQNSEAVSSDAAVMSSFQSNQSVVSFNEDPWTWMKQTASAIFTQIGESIMERFGCAQWENPSRPFMSKCLRPLPWSCADCSAKTNMVCGVLGYIGGEILVSFFTGAAVGIVARTAARIGVEAAIHFPRATATVGRVAAFGSRWAARGGASVRNIWQNISRTPAAQVIGGVASGAISRAGRAVSATSRYVVSANEFARRRIFIFAGAQDLGAASVKEFNRLAQEAFSLGYRSTGTARSSAITNLEAKYTKLSDVTSGAYGSLGIRTTDDFLRYSTREMSRENAANIRLSITQDGADSRILITSNLEVEAGRGAAYQLTGPVRAPAATVTLPPTPRNPSLIERPPEPVVAVPEQIIEVRAIRGSTTRYPEIPVSTRSQSDVLRALGPDTPYNRELANITRGEFRFPSDLDIAALDLHDAWKAANPNLRQSRPELFVDFDQLPVAEKLRYADELGRGFREANPAVASSEAFRDFKASLTPEVTPGTVTANVVAPADEVLDIQRGNRLERQGITVGSNTPRAPSTSIQRVIPEAPNVADDIVTDLTTGRSTTRTNRGENALTRFGGEHVSYQDREIILDILMGGPRKNSYFGGGSAKPAAFQSRYSELEAQILRDPELPRLKIEVESLALDRITVGNRKTAEELADLERQGIRAQKNDIPCSAFANVTPGAFPAEGNCKRVKFDQDVNGRYCSCGAMGKTSFTWLVRCPTSTTDFSSLATYVDELALPFDSAPEMCTRVDIPRGKECYLGPTSATFAGFGGATQLLCEHRAARSPAGQADVASYGLDFGGQSVKPVRWSPFTSHVELQEIIQRASTACTTVCDVNEYRSLRQRYDQAIATLRQGASPSELARLEVEARGFDQYMRELGEGRKTYPTSSEFSPATPAPQVLRSPQRAVGGSTANRLGPPPPPAVVIAAIREKNLQHVRLTPEQTAYIDDLVEKRNGSEMSIDDIIEQMDNRSGVQNPARPFRGDRITSFFPAGTGPDDVMEAYSRGDLRFINSNGSTRKFQGEVNGNRYTMYVCEAETCVANGITVRRNEVTSISPECGPGIRALPRLSRAKDVLRQSTPITRDSFFVPMPCAN